MEVRVVFLDTANVDELDELYQQSLTFIDDDAKANLNKYYHRIDSVRGLIGRLLPRLLLKAKGIPLAAMTFAKTSADIHRPGAHRVQYYP